MIKHVIFQHAKFVPSKMCMSQLSSPLDAILSGQWRPQMRDLALIPCVGLRWWTRVRVNSPFYKLITPANQNKCGIKTIDLAKTTPLYLSFKHLTKILNRQQRCQVLAVTNNQIRPPIIVQNRRNKHTFDTYAFTINIVPLVLQDYYFARLILEYNGIIVKIHLQRKRNADHTPRNQAKTHPTT
jgi:hypothetical protein